MKEKYIAIINFFSLSFEIYPTAAISVFFEQIFLFTIPFLLNHTNTNASSLFIPYYYFHFHYRSLHPESYFVIRLTATSFASFVTLTSISEYDACFSSWSLLKVSVGCLCFAGRGPPFRFPLRNHCFIYHLQTKSPEVQAIFSERGNCFWASTFCRPPPHIEILKLLSIFLIPSRFVFWLLFILFLRYSSLVFFHFMLGTLNWKYFWCTWLPPSCTLTPSFWFSEIHSERCMFGDYF